MIRKAGWTLTEDGDGMGWSAGGYIVSEEDITLIAQWEALDTLKLPEDLTKISEEAFAGTDRFHRRLLSVSWLNCCQGLNEGREKPLSDKS